MARWPKSGRNTRNNTATPTWRRFSFAPRARTARPTPPTRRTPRRRSNHDRRICLPDLEFVEKPHVDAGPAVEAAQVSHRADRGGAVFLLFLRVPFFHRSG